MKSKIIILLLVIQVFSYSSIIYGDQHTDIPNTNLTHTTLNSQVPPSVSIGQSILGSFDQSQKTDGTLQTTTLVTQPEIISYMIFANSRSEFNALLENLDVIKSYSTLMAINFRGLNSQWDPIAEQFSDSVFVYDGPQVKYYDLVESTNSGTSQQSPPVLIPNAQIDADIMNVSPLWSQGYNGTGAVVAVFDNGVDFTHPALQGQGYPGLESVDFSVDFNGVSTAPCFNHGTPVAGNIASTGLTNTNTSDPDLRGNAFGAKIISVNAGCIGANGLIADWIAGFDWIANRSNIIDIVNTSWGGGSTDPVFDVALERMTAAGVLLVGSAGNGGPNKGTTIAGSPGNSIYSLSVAASEYPAFANGPNNPTGFSSRGPSNFLYKPDVLAPGVDVISPLLGGGYGPISGTSFSSPLTAGALATVISALEANGISHNPGILKAGVMRSAVPQLGVALAEGKGLVNAEGMFNLLINQNLTTPFIHEVTPRDGPLSFLTRLLSDLQLTIPITYISSAPTLSTASISGNISQIASLGVIQDKFSQAIDLNIDTTGAVNGFYTGSVDFTLNGEIVSAVLSFNVIGQLRAKGMIDTRHTYLNELGENTLGGTKIATMIDLAIQQGIWFDLVNDEITDALLSNYDVLWMPDPVNNRVVFEGEEDYEFPLLQSEVTAIVNFVNNGGSAFINFLGPYLNSNGDLRGTDAPTINNLISNFDITVSSTPITNLQLSRIDLINSSYPVGAAKQINHRGNFLNVGPSAIPLSTTEFGPTIAIQDIPASGRVLVTSTNVWFDNSGIAGDYSIDPIGNAIISRNIWDWLITEKRMHLISSSFVNNQVQAEFQIFENGVAATNPVVKLHGNDLVQEEIISVIDLGSNRYSFTFNIDQEGLNQIQASFGAAKDYLNWEGLIDLTAPFIELEASMTNKTGFNKGSTLFLKFIVTDTLYKIGAADVTITLNGTSNELITHSYLENKNKVTVTVPAELVNSTGPVWYILNVIASDDAGNVGQLDFWFYVGNDVPVDPNPFVPTTTSEPPTTSEPTTSSPPETSTTPIETSSEKSNENGTPFYFFTPLILLFVGYQLIRRRFR